MKGILIAGMCECESSGEFVAAQSIEDVECWDVMVLVYRDADGGLVDSLDDIEGITTKDEAESVAKTLSEKHGGCPVAYNY